MFPTNNFTLLAASIYALYNARWQAELFLKWIKQFFSTSDNAVKSNIGIAVSVYVLVAIVKKRLNLDALLHTLLQIFPVTFFWKMPLQQACPGSDHKGEQGNDCNQANQFAF